MTTVAILEAAALLGMGVALATLLNVYRRTVRGYQRREDDWANRVMHMKGYTWAPPPLETGEPPERAVEYEHAPEPEV